METLERNEAAVLLKERGITPTRQRIEIAQHLFARCQHVCAEQLMAQVNSERPRVSKATVYNTLNLFSRKGLVREILVDPVKVFYDSNLEPHYHFYNVDTGELSDVPDGCARVEALPELPEGTAIDGIEVVIRIRQAKASFAR